MIMILVAGLCLLYTFRQVEGLKCYCNHGDDCINGSCDASDHYHKYSCEVEAKIYTNSTVDLRHTCNTQPLLPCHEHPIDNTFYGCCDDKDYCNRCMLPKLLPKESYKKVIPLFDPNCSFPSSLFPPPRTTLIPTTPRITLNPNNNLTDNGLGSHNIYVYGTIIIVSVTTTLVVSVLVFLAIVFLLRRKSHSDKV